MNKKISNKDLKDWIKFTEGKEKVFDKDINTRKLDIYFLEKTIDLHGYTLENANNKIKEFINYCHSIGISKINVITGKGSGSTNKNDPYQSYKLGILKHSVPDFINSNKELMKKIKEINFKDVNDSSKGSFEIFLKKIKNE